MFEKTVADIMTRNVVVLSEEDNLGLIEAGMERYHFRHIPVVDGDRVVGILSDRDLARLSSSPLEHPRDQGAHDRAMKARTFVAEVMRRDVLTVTPDTLVLAAARLVLGSKIGALPVVTREGSLVGIVTTHDLLRATIEALDASIAPPPAAPEDAGL
ncbi:MAG: CBS domain-containing protein [Polyangiales bacterium]